jgi:hypothetical protein
VEEPSKFEIDTVPNRAYLYPTEDTVSIEKLKLLGKHFFESEGNFSMSLFSESSQELKAMLGNPHLQTILKHLDSTKDPKNAMEDAMQEPIFMEFADACMSVVEPE